MRIAPLASVVAVAVAAGSASAQMRITEWMYDSTTGGYEFIEFTNIGNSPIDMTGWAFDDNHFGGSDPDPYDLSAFGVVAPGESVILTEGTVAQFRAEWSLPLAVKVIGLLGDATTGGYNIGRNDSLVLIDNFGVVADRLDYGDQTFPGTIRTRDISGVPMSMAALGANDVTQWRFSVVGDEYFSYASATGNIGSPGYFIPAPASAGVLLVAGLCGMRRRRA
ncbi:MAG: lamin tail domain-containing protein [Phycisphaeraceae bacterium]|nr:lamin tail domain-containing protein [Phycisphaeraceae bacterium]MCW5753369.1 lamin tail domain-containing protein [Phycisphaeraceae bacterium]